MYYSTVWNGQRGTGNDDDDDAWMDGQTIMMELKETEGRKPGTRKR